MEKPLRTVTGKEFGDVAEVTSKNRDGHRRTENFSDVKEVTSQSLDKIFSDMQQAVVENSDRQRTLAAWKK